MITTTTALQSTRRAGNEDPHPNDMCALYPSHMQPSSYNSILQLERARQGLQVKAKEPGRAPGARFRLPRRATKSAGHKGHTAAAKGEKHNSSKRKNTAAARGRDSQPAAGNLATPRLPF